MLIGIVSIAFDAATEKVKHELAVDKMVVRVLARAQPWYEGIDLEVSERQPQAHAPTPMPPPF